jgi:ribonuclease HIII
MKKIIIDVNTQEETIVDYTEKELAQVAKEAKFIAAKEAEAEAKATAKAALLAQLGITEEQAKLLLS